MSLRPTYDGGRPRGGVVGNPVGGGVGWGNWQPMATGELPELGLTAETSFI